VLSEARLIADKIVELEKPLASILITHPHPDHYNGLASLLERFPGTRVHATAATIHGISETAEPKRVYWAPIVGSDYPQRFVIPDVTVGDGQHLSIDGIELIVYDFGPTECSDNTAIELPQIDAVIISDLVYHGVHPWLAEGRSELWLAALSKAKDRFDSAQMVYAGHGTPGPACIIGEQSAYINAVREIVAGALQQDPDLSGKTRAAIQQRVRAAYENWPLEILIDTNTTSLAAEAKSQSWKPAAAVV